jgi:hypothetical protein
LLAADGVPAGSLFKQAVSGGNRLAGPNLSAVMPALVAGIHVFLLRRQDKQDVDGRDKPGHKDRKWLRIQLWEDKGLLYEQRSVVKEYILCGVEPMTGVAHNALGMDLSNVQRCPCSIDWLPEAHSRRF